MSSDLVISQQLLEQNEDIIAAIVENLQLGRLNDCMQHYAILQSNLVSLATELDNFPADEYDPYSKLDIFPDEIMRKDVLEDLRPPGARPLPNPPVVPACTECMLRGRAAYECRIELGHVEPSGKFTSTEREEFIHATQMLATRYEQHQRDVQDIKGTGTGTGRRTYKNWSEHELYTLAVSWWLLRASTSDMAEAFEDRTASQIRSMISRKTKENDWPPKKSAKELMDERDPSYQPPAILAKYFAAHAAGLDPYTVRDSTVVPVHAEEIDRAAATATQSLLSPQLDQPDFNLLLSIAAGANTMELTELQPRVPSSPPLESMLLSRNEDDPDAMPIITDVGGVNEREAAAMTERVESAFVAVSQATNGGSALTEKEVHIRMPNSFPSAGSQQGSGASHSARKVHWGANTESILPAGTTGGDSAEHSQDTDNSSGQPLYPRYPAAAGAAPVAPNNSNSSSIGSVSSITQGPLLLPSLRDPSVSSYLPPPPSRAPHYLRDPLKELLASKEPPSRSPAGGKKSQQPSGKEGIDLLDGSALAGLDSYNLEYARTLQLAGVPFRMTTGSGTVVVVKSSGTTTTSATPNTVTIKAPRTSQAPPFAQPGIERMRQQQAKRKLSPTPGSNEDEGSVGAESSASGSGTGGASGSSSKFVTWTSAATKRRNAAAAAAASEEEVSMSPSQFTQQLEAVLHQTRPATHPSVSEANTAKSHAEDLASHRQRLIQNQNMSVTQLTKQKKTGAGASKKSGGSAQQSQSAAHVATQQTNVSFEDIEDAEASRNLRAFTSSLPLAAQVNQSAGSLFSQIIIGAGSTPARSASSASNASPPNFLQEAVSRIGGSHERAAALDVSMSGYDDDEGNTTSHSRAGTRSSRQDSAGAGRGEDSALPEFGCEFSFL